MANKYNLALIPMNSQEGLITFAKPFNALCHDYLIGKQSWPHVTLRHFYADVASITVTWQTIIKKLEFQKLTLHFKQKSFITFNNQTYFLSFLPEEKQWLINLHEKVSAILAIPKKNNYDPHMTICNTKITCLTKEWEQKIFAFLPFTDSFILALGCADKAGQITKIIFSSA